MKKLSLIIITTICTVPATYADNSATATIRVSGNIIKSGEITAKRTMILPNLVVPARGEENTSVMLTCDNSGGTKTTYSKAGNPSTSSNPNINNSSSTCATTRIKGQPDYSFSITVTSPPTNTGHISVADVNCNSKTTTLDSNGNATLYCGALVTAQAGATTGLHTMTSNLIVTYD
jgi:hypothetical protein